MPHASTASTRGARLLACFAVSPALALAGCQTVAVDPLPLPEPERECARGTLLGSGSVAQMGALEVAITAYGSACRGANTVQYDPIGSAGGITEFGNGLTHFAGSDVVLTEEQTAVATRRCLDNPVWHVPVLVEPIGLAYNLEGVDDLRLTPELVAQIFSGDIDTWDDARIAAVNPDAELPAETISVVHRLDTSGTTQNVTRWLHGVAPEVWPAEWVSPNWKGAGQGEQGSAGVAAAIAGTHGAIGYLEAVGDRARGGATPTPTATPTASPTPPGGLAMAGIVRADRVVRPDARAATAAVAEATHVGGEHDLRLDLPTDPVDPAAYPLVQVTYEIICSAGIAPENTAVLTDFLTFLTEDPTRETLTARGYLPVPATVNEQARATIAAVR